MVAKFRKLLLQIIMQIW